MKRTALMGLGIIMASGASAQHVLAPAGSSGTGPGLEVAWTIGEPLITTGSSASTIATQGFHQPLTDFSTAIAPVSDNTDWQLFPNPTRGLLQLTTTSSEAHHAIVLNALGQHVGAWSISEPINTWRVDHLASGTYRLRVVDRNNHELHTLPFIVTP